MRIFFIFASVLCLSAQAQKKPALPKMPDLATLQKMTPSQQKAYQQQMLKQLSKNAKSMSAAYNMPIDEMRLPDFALQLPPKDRNRLALIPKQPPTLVQLADGLRQSKNQLESLASKEVLNEVKTVIEKQSPAQQQSAAVASFYSDKPVHALLLSMNSVLQNMQEPTAWNNLAALYNMTGLQHKAIPVLMNQLQQLPKSPLLLNNMGQAYLGLGDVTNAEQYLRQCLAEDPLNPEANRSMGMIRFAQKRFEEGTKFFEKELEIARRGSTLALLKKQGQKINLSSLHKKRLDQGQRNYFEEINLAQFIVPDFPGSCDETEMAEKKGETFLQSVVQEQLFWYNTATTSTEEDKNIEQFQNVSVYADMVEEMLDDLHHSTFPAENLTLFSPADLNALKEKTEAYYKKLAELKCPEPPEMATSAVLEAYQLQCCELRKAISQSYMLDYNSFVRNRISIVQARWKDYLNSLISIVHYNPSPGNKKMVYGMVAEYFNFLATAWQSAVLIKGCKPGMTAEEAAALIESSRQIDFRCPGWMNISISLGIASMKTSCSSYSIEGGELVQWAYEKDFTTGTSTLAAGVGVDASFQGILKASANHMLYLSFDNNNKFADMGIRGGVNLGMGWQTESLLIEKAGKISGKLAGVEAGYSIGWNSGMTSKIKGKGVLADFIKLEGNFKPNF